MDGGRITAYPGPRAEQLLRDLEEREEDELDALFEHGETPGPGDCGEETRGRILRWHRGNASWFVRMMVKLLFESPVGRWTGKEFTRAFSEDEKGSGVNLFRSRIRPRRFRFGTYIKEAYRHEGECLALDYGEYRSLMSGLVDDVRKIDGGLLLGQMHYRALFGSERRFMGYFALCPLQDGPGNGPAGGE